jgi:Flp pilus assembly protein TadD
VLLDLQRRLSDGGLRIVCAKDSYVHSPEEDSDIWKRECRAVRMLLDARKSASGRIPDQAVEHLNRALRVKPDYAEALYERGLLHVFRGDDTDAVRDFENLVLIDPDDTRAHNNLGCLHFKQGRNEDAEACFKRAIEADPENWEAQKNLADLYLNTGKGDNASALYESIMKQHGDCPEVHTALGDMFANFGDLDTAGRLYESALRLDPHQTAAKAGLRVLALARADSP